MVLSVLILWLGCLTTFLASSQQAFFPKRLSKKLAWPVFVCAYVLATWLATNVYPVISSAILTLVIVSLMWTSIVFIHGHIRTRLTPFAFGGGVVSALLIGIGGW